MFRKGKKLFPKASYSGVNIVYTLCILAKRLWFFVWFLHISTASEFFVYITFYMYLVILSILCFECPKVVKEMKSSIGSNKGHPCKSISALLDFPLELENS